MKKLEGKVAVITGGNSGIGLATAQRFVDEGAYVFITGRRQTELDDAVKKIGDNVTGVQGDMSNLADLDRLYDTVKQQKGQLDILFANAGLGEFLPWEKISEAHYDKTFSVNVKGVLFTIYNVLRYKTLYFFAYLFCNRLLCMSNCPFTFPQSLFGLIDFL